MKDNILENNDTPAIPPTSREERTLGLHVEVRANGSLLLTCSPYIYCSNDDGRFLRSDERNYIDLASPNIHQLERAEIALLETLRLLRDLKTLVVSAQ
jgi:hypothetical protein